MYHPHKEVGLLALWERGSHQVLLLDDRIEPPPVRPSFTPCTWPSYVELMNSIHTAIGLV